MLKKCPQNKSKPDNLDPNSLNPKYLIKGGPFSGSFDLGVWGGGGYAFSWKTYIFIKVTTNAKANFFSDTLRNKLFFPDTTKNNLFPTSVHPPFSIKEASACSKISVNIP